MDNDRTPVAADTVRRAAIEMTCFGETTLELPDDLSFDEWADLGSTLVRMERSVLWWLGEWWLHGERHYGEAAAAALPTGYSAETLRKAAWVAEHVPQSVRRPTVPFHHHDAVAGLRPRQQKAILARAEAENLSQRQVRDAVRDVKAREVRAERTASLADKPAVDLRRGDFRECLGDVEDGSVDVVVTDPPYKSEFLPLYSDLSKHAARWLKPGGLAVVMAGQSYLPEVIDRLGEHLSYHWTIAYLMPGGQAVQVWPRKVNTFWKPVLVFRNGDKFHGDWFGDVATSDANDNDKDHHVWGQSESGMTDLLGRVSAEGDLVCDPFLGGGTTAVVAARMGRRCVGCDVDWK